MGRSLDAKNKLAECTGQDPAKLDTHIAAGNGMCKKLGKFVAGDIMKAADADDAEMGKLAKGCDQAGEMGMWSDMTTEDMDWPAVLAIGQQRMLPVDDGRLKTAVGLCAEALINSQDVSVKWHHDSQLGHL